MTAGHAIAQRLYEAKKCSVCGTTEGTLHRHHIDGDTFNNEPDNILICCPRCHMTEDGRIDKAARRLKELMLMKLKTAPGRCAICNKPLVLGKNRYNMCKICDQRVSRRMLMDNPPRPIASKPRCKLNRAIGTENASAKLTDKDVRFIKQSNKTTAELARMFSVAWPSIDKVRKGLRWRHVS